MIFRIIDINYFFALRFFKNVAKIKFSMCCYSFVFKQFYNQIIIEDILIRANSLCDVKVL